MGSNKTVNEKYIIKNFDEAVKNGYIKTYFQPIIRTLTGEVCGFESLARWDAPSCGLLSPALFIDTLEKNRMIHLLDMAMFENVCKKYDHFLKKGVEPLPFSLNLSRLDFEKEDLFESIISVLNKYNVPTSAIRIEITESVALENKEKFRKIFDRFRDRGFEIWMDDFGSGYSSLNVLKDYDFDLLKIDMLFLSNMSYRSKKIIASIVNMAKSLGIHTLAEGVETHEQVEFLKEIGCEMLQGYYYSKPLSGNDTEAYLGSQKAEEGENRKYWSEAGMLNVLSASPFDEYSDGRSETQEGAAIVKYPLAIMEMIDEDRLVFPYINEAYNDLLKEMGFTSLEEMIYVVNDKSKPYFHDTRRQLRQTAETKGTVKKDYVTDNICYSFTTAFITQTKNKIMVAVSIYIFAKEALDRHLDDVNRYNKALFYNFELVNIVRPEKDSAKRIYSNSVFGKTYGTNSLKKGISEFAKNEVYIDDKQRYLEFMDFSTVDDRINADESSFVQQPFRFKKHDGGYRWLLARLTKIPSLGENYYMYSIQKMSPVDADIIDKKISEEPNIFKK